MLVRITGLLLLALIATTSAAESETWQIESRVVPIPAGASPVLGASIASRGVPDVAGMRRQVPQNREGWDALIAQRAAERKRTLGDVESAYNVAITTDTIAGVPVYRVTPNIVARAHAEHLLFYVHGGAYVFGGGDASVGEAAIIANVAGIPALSVDYRMPPAHPFPAAVDDSVAVYRDVLKEYAPSAIAFGGSSAGGGLALATTHQLKALGLPLPGAIYAGTPWADLTKTGDTLFTNEGLDRVLVTYDGSLGAAARLYADGHDMKDPLLSPVYGNFEGFPPTILITGTRDMFLSDTVRTHQKLRAAGAIADLHVFEAMSHAGYAFVLDSPESQQAYQQISQFLSTHLR